MMLFLGQLILVSQKNFLLIFWSKECNKFFEVSFGTNFFFLITHFFPKFWTPFHSGVLENGLISLVERLTWFTHGHENT